MMTTCRMITRRPFVSLVICILFGSISYYMFTSDSAARNPAFGALKDDVTIRATCGSMTRVAKDAPSDFGKSTLKIVRTFDHPSTSHPLPIIYVITPTGARLEQKADLTRLSQTLRHVNSLRWIVVEDREGRSNMVRDLLVRSGLMYTHLNISTPKELKESMNDKNHIAHPRGVAQRNGGIKWIRKHGKLPGVAYFADDDNTYDLRLFDEMRYTKKVSVWPVGLAARQRYESPIVENGVVTGWFTSVARNRTFGTDMAGFAINTKLLLDNPGAQFRNKPFMLETDFLSQLNITWADLEPMADNCTKVLVWHTRTTRSSLAGEDTLKNLHGHGTDEDIEI